MQVELVDRLSELPEGLPLFPLQGSVLLPRAHLPIQIYEPHHLAMVTEAIQGSGFVGVVQPSDIRELFRDAVVQPLYTAGTAAIVSNFHEEEEGQFVVTLTGICRFDILKETQTPQGYRKASVCYDRYQSDLAEESDFVIDRGRLFPVLRRYFLNMEIDADWEEIEKTSNEKLLAALTMVCPFEPREKQALLETPTPAEQSQLITALIEMATFHSPNLISTCH